MLCNRAAAHCRLPELWSARTRAQERKPAWVSLAMPSGVASASPGASPCTPCCRWRSNALAGHSLEMGAGSVSLSDSDSAPSFRRLCPTLAQCTPTCSAISLSFIAADVSYGPAQAWAQELQQVWASDAMPADAVWAQPGAPGRCSPSSSCGHQCTCGSAWVCWKRERGDLFHFRIPKVLTVSTAINWGISPPCVCVGRAIRCGSRTRS